MKKKLELSETLRLKNEAEIIANRYFIYTLLAISILGFVILALGYNTVNQNHKLAKLKLEQEKHEEKLAATNAERNRIAKELHDDIGSTLSSIAIYSDVALKELGTSSTKSQELLSRINLKSKELSDNMSDIIWAVYTKNDSFNNFFMRMKNFAFEITNPLDIEVEFKLPQSLETMALRLEQRKNLYYIFKEAINNAVKHSKCTKIMVSFKMDDENLITMSIQDNGSGFDVNAENNGNGLSNLRYRAEQIGGKITFLSNEKTGTLVSVKFPINQSAHP